MPIERDYHANIGHLRRSVASLIEVGEVEPSTILIQIDRLAEVLDDLVADVFSTEDRIAEGIVQLTQAQVRAAERNSDELGYAHRY